MTKTYTAKRKVGGTLRWPELAQWMAQLVLLALVGLAAGQASAAGDGQNGPTIQHGPVQTLSMPKSMQANMAGASATLLPDGKWLLLGGTAQASGKSLASARIYHAEQQQLASLSQGLLYARAYHSATLLPDGRVLVLGGYGKNGALVQSAEVFDPEADNSVAKPDAGFLLRARHRANLLADGRVLVAGGVDGQGAAMAEAEIYDPAGGTAGLSDARLAKARYSHLSALLPNHSVLLWDGVGADGTAIGDAESYDPALRQFLSVELNAAAQAIDELKSSAAPALVDSYPLDGAQAVDGAIKLSLRFSKPLRVASLNKDTLALVGPEGQVAVTVTPAEGGLIAFVLPKEELSPASDYTLIVQDAADNDGQPLPFTSIGFKTRALGTGATQGGQSQDTAQAGTAQEAVAGGATASQSSASANASTQAAANSAGKAADSAQNTSQSADATATEYLTVGLAQRQGQWRTGRPLPKAVVALRDLQEPHRKRIEHLRARLNTSTSAKGSSLADDPSVTGVGGLVLKLDDQPLAGVTVSVDGKSAKTGADGRFVLTGITPGHREMVVDGRNAGANGAEYLQVVIGVEVRSKGLTELSYGIFLPKVQANDWIDLPSPTQADMSVTHPSLPGKELLRIPKGTVVRGLDGKVLTRVALVPVPLDRAPYPTPAAFPMYFMLHPGGAMVGGTNTAGVQTLYPNTDNQPAGSEQRLWFYDSHDSGWKVYGTGHVSQDGTLIEPDTGAALHEHAGAGHGAVRGKARPAIATAPGCPCSKVSDPVDVSTGLFLHERTDVGLADDIPIEITRTYRPGDTVVRAFGKGASLNYGMYLRSEPDGTFDSVDLILPDGGRVNFPLKPGGTNIHTNYVWEHTATPTRFYGARLTAPADSAGERWELWLKDGTLYTFNLGGQLTNIKDRRSNQLYFSYSGGTIQRITSQNGRYVDLQYDGYQRVTQITDIFGRVWSYEYDTAGYLSKATYPDATYEQYTYDTAGQMLTVRDRRGNTMVANEYDANGRVGRQTLADGAVFSYAYTLDANGKVSQTDVTDPRGNVRRRQFNPAGYLTSLTLAAGTALQQTYSYTLNAANQVTDATDPLGRVAHYSYDAKGNTTQVTRLYGTPQALSWNYSYESSFNLPSAATDPLGHTTAFSYDTQGNLTRSEDALGHRLDMAYDGWGHMTAASRYANGASLTTSLAYDAGDLVQVQDPLGRVAEFYPDMLGRVVNSKDPLGLYTHRDYDAADRVVAYTDAQGLTENYSYDAHGNLLTFTDAKSQATAFGYDPRDRPAGKTDALGRSDSWQYDAAGNLLFHTDRKGQVAGFTYDALDRRTAAGYGASSTANPVYLSTTAYSYDATNRLTQLVDSLGGTLAWSYDDRFDAVTQESGPQGTVGYTYSADGSRSGLTPSNGTAIGYSYDAARRLTAISQAAGTGQAVPNTAQTVGLQYDDAGRPTRLTLPNGITQDFGFDAAGQLLSLTYKHPDGTALGDLTYSYDANGQRTATAGSLARTALPQATQNSQYDANNRLTAKDGLTYSYDANGNLTSDGVNSYSWNERNQLVSITGTDSFSYAYDGLGRRVQVTKNGQTTTTLHDGWNPIQLQEGGVPVENRLMGMGLDALYARTRGGVTETYLRDALGSTLELRDGQRAQTVQYTYDPYGLTTASAGSTNLAKYTGREQDGADLYYYRHRYYKPSIGRFISEDPIGLAGGSNLHAYVRNNPIRYTDPAGLLVNAVLDTNANTLTVTDEDTGDSIVVSAFTGGHADTDGAITSPGYTAEEVPAPKGSYWITQNPNVKPGHEDWYGVIKQDDRIDDYFSDGGNVRSGIRLHLGGISWGCATVNNYAPGADMDWARIKDLIGNTSTSALDFRNGPYWYNGTTQLINYGTLTIK